VKNIFAMLSLLLAVGCSLPAAKSREPGDTAALHTDLIRGLLAQGQYYAALAHIDDERRQSGDNDELRALRGDALSSLGRTAEADAAYRSLLKGPHAGEAYHGLGMLRVRSDPAAGIGYLRAAVQQRPTSAEWRNDLGYALMSAGRLQEALTELATATELAPGVERYRNNLVILLVLRKDEAGLTRLAKQWNVTPATLAELRRRAASVPVRTAQPPVKPAPAH
jgi:Flp pilus assembly protein TadD